MQYNCDTGYALLGISSSRLCGADREWTGNEPRCALANCPDHASGAPLCKCVAGYMGEMTFSEQMWTGTCVVRSCGALKVPEHGAMGSGAADSSATLFSCNPDYVLASGHSSRMCGDDGAWDGNRASCTHVPCGSLPAPADHVIREGNLDAHAQVLARVLYSCRAGYLLDTGTTSRACGSDDNQWSGNEPTCSMASCPANAGGAPMCECDLSYVGVLRWDASQDSDTWDGVCSIDAGAGSSQPFC